MASWMYRGGRVDPKGGFGDYAKDLFDKPDHSDVAIVLDNDDLQGAEKTPTKTFHGHRVILATMSDYFRTMLFGSFLEAGKKEIRLTGVPYSVFMDLMRYVYLGWTCPDEKSLEELIEFYSLGRMLLLDAKMNPCFDRWMAATVEKWPTKVFKLLSLALEWNLDHLKDKCTERFCVTANEYLACSSFVELSMQAVNYIINLDGMNCFNKDLKTAIKAWIKHHKDELSTETIEGLNKKANERPEYCFNTDDFDVHSLYEDQRTPEEEPTEDFVPLGNVLNSTSQEYCYSCVFGTQRECIVLKGIKIYLKPNLQYGPQHGRVKSEFQLNFQVAVSYGYQERDRHSRTLTVRYDFTKSKGRIPVTIFFPDFYVCMGSILRFEFQWQGVGVQPLLQQFGPINEEHCTFRTGSSYVSHMIYMEKYCRLHSDSEEDMDDDTEDDDF